MSRIPIDFLNEIRGSHFLNEIRGSHLNALLLARVSELSNKASSQKETPDQAYTQSLFEFAKENLGITSSTCYSRLRLLRIGGFLEEESGVKKGKSIIGYTITPDGEDLLKALTLETERILNLCKKNSGGKNA